MLNAVLMTNPALPHKLYELAINILGCAAAFFPVKNELGPNAVVKGGGNLRSREDFFRILTGLPLIIEFWWCLDIERRVLLAAAPLG